MLLQLTRFNCFTKYLCSYYKLSSQDIPPLTISCYQQVTKPYMSYYVVTSFVTMILTKELSYGTGQFHGYTEFHLTHAKSSKSVYGLHDDIKDYCQEAPSKPKLEVNYHIIYN